MRKTDEQRLVTMPEPETYKYPNKSFAVKIIQLTIGIFLSVSTIYLIILISGQSFQKNNSVRHVASFVAGMFGFTAIQVLRQTLDES